jgi:hypothetical protein
MTTHFKIPTVHTTEAKLMSLLDLYNDLLTTNFHIRGGTQEYKYHRTVKDGKALSEMFFYEDLIHLYSVIVHLGVKPRDYIMYQIKTYKPPTKFSRMTPTIRMLTTPAAIEKWENQFVKIKSSMSEEDRDSLNKEYIETLMRANGISSEEEFFKDPILISQVSKSFLVKNPVFKRLLAEGYYLKTFKLKTSDLL